MTVSLAVQGGTVLMPSGRAFRAADVLSVQSGPGSNNPCGHYGPGCVVVWAFMADGREHVLWHAVASLPNAEVDADRAAVRFVAACKTAMTGRAVTVDADLRTVSMDPPPAFVELPG